VTILAVVLDDDLRDLIRRMLERSTRVIDAAVTDAT
jgi:hypothetical protein